MLLCCTRASPQGEEVAPGPDTRRIAFEFHAGPYTPQELAVTAFTGREELSRAFAFTVELAATEEAPLQPQEMLGQKAVLSLQDGVTGTGRFVHGMIGRVEALGERQGRLRYRALLVPRLLEAAPRAPQPHLPAEEPSRRSSSRCWMRRASRTARA